MADVNGKKLKVGDIIEIVQMDDPTYQFLVGVRGVVDTLPEEAKDTQVIVVLEHESVPGASTHQKWVRKVE